MMLPAVPDLGFYHPLVVHFVIALALVGVPLRWLALSGRARFAGPAATVLIVLAMGAAVVATRSGGDASVDAEALPGLAAPVRAHALWGRRTRNLLLLLGACEAAAACGRGPWRRRGALLAGAVGVAVLASVYETGKRGGDLVYAYAAGVGVHSGDPADVGRLLLAGLYQQAQLDARAGRSDAAATLIELAARRFPADAAVQVLAGESLLENRHDPAAALRVLERATVPVAERSLRFRRGWLTADALEALGRSDAARSALTELRKEFPHSRRLQRRLDAPRAPAL